MKKYLLLFLAPILFGFDYPVDLDGRYIRYSDADADVRGQIRAWPRADGMPIEGLDPDLRPLKVVIADRPAYDLDTHSLNPGWVIDLVAEEYRREWTAVPLSAEDLAEIQEDNELEAERLQAIAIYQELKNGVGNNGERIVRIEKTVAHILRMLYQP